jgi:tetratricopeptide (TPR) repeat protein
MYRSLGLSALLLMAPLLVIEAQWVEAIEQTRVVAKSAAEVEAITKAVTVEIKLQQNQSVGSGIIIHKQKDIYTLITNRHVICGSEMKTDKICEKLPKNEKYIIQLFDRQQYLLTATSIKLLGDGLDLAIIQFRSKRNYQVAKIAAPGSLKVDDNVYTAGFPVGQGYTFGTGQAIAVVNKRLTGDIGGYTIVYDSPTLPGMSGGGVFNSSGQLVAIHGYGDRFRKNTDIYDHNESRVGTKIGYNRGIPVRWMLQNLAELGIYSETTGSITVIKAARAQVPATADEHFIAGFNKLVEPGDNVEAGKQQAIEEFSKAIGLNPKYKRAYYMRAIAHAQVRALQASLADFNQAITLNPRDSRPYEFRGIIKSELNDVQGALADFNEAIALNPRDYNIYYNRGIFKALKLNDVQGALDDYSKVIALNPRDYLAYNNRGNLKRREENYQGALADFNQAILINPNYSRAYMNRALLKKNELNNRVGAIQDFRQAAKIYRERGQIANLNEAISELQQLDATE